MFLADGKAVGKHSSAIPDMAKQVDVGGNSLSPYPPAPSHHETISICAIRIRTVATAGVLPRIIEHLAKRSLVPMAFSADYSRNSRGEYLDVKLTVAAELAKVQHIAVCWEGTPDVISVVMKKLRRAIRSL